jgi:hypothetical protein
VKTEAAALCTGLANESLLEHLYSDAPVVQEAMNMVFTALYMAEVVIKMISFGPVTFLQPLWNRFDSSLVLLGSLDLLVAMLPASSLRLLRVVQLQQLFRLLRVFRLLRIFHNFQSLMHLIMVLQRSIEGLWHVGTVVFFVFYVYAYLGVLVFGKACIIPRT